MQKKTQKKLKIKNYICYQFHPRNSYQKAFIKHCFNRSNNIYSSTLSGRQY